VSLNSKVIARTPDHLGAHHDRAYAYELLDRKEEASQDRLTLNSLKHRRIWKKFGGKVTKDHLVTPPQRAPIPTVQNPHQTQPHPQ